MKANNKQTDLLIGLEYILAPARQRSLHRNFSFVFSLFNNLSSSVFESGNKFCQVSRRQLLFQFVNKNVSSIFR